MSVGTSNVSNESFKFSTGCAYGNVPGGGAGTTVARDAVAGVCGVIPGSIEMWSGSTFVMTGFHAAVCTGEDCVWCAPTLVCSPDVVEVALSGSSVHVADGVDSDVVAEDEATFHS